MKSIRLKTLLYQDLVQHLYFKLSLHRVHLHQKHHLHENRCLDSLRFLLIVFLLLVFFFSDSCSLQISISIQHCTPISALVGRGGVWVDELTSTTLSVCVSLVLYSNSKRSTCSLCKKASSQCCRFALSCSLKMLNFLFAGCLSAL